MHKHSIIGIMSGTSLDGIDLAHCTFEENENGYSFRIGACTTIPYTKEWQSRLQQLPASSAHEFALTHTAYGRLLGEITRQFIESNKLSVDFVASHGHTIFHNPAAGYTTQIGEGAALANACGLPVVCDFRTGDVAAGGQGAPLVPMGDALLFSEYDYRLNLGGFANISLQSGDKIIAFDISPANIALNYYANKAGKEFDESGKLAASGQVSDVLLSKLNALAYYALHPPKSLGREWFEEVFLAVTNQYQIAPADFLSTICEHIALQIAACLPTDKTKRLLITGGGAYNKYLISRLSYYTDIQIVIPEKSIIDYKEALIFALLGLLRYRLQPNCLSSVTGASKNVSGGAIYLP